MAVRDDKKRVTISLSKYLLDWIQEVKPCFDTISEFIEHCLEEKYYDKKTK